MEILKLFRLVVALTAGCASAAETSPPAKTGHSHALPMGVGSLDVVARGDTLDLLFAEYGAGTNPPALMHTRSRNAGVTWSLPVRVDAGNSGAHRPHRGLDPQIAAAGDNLLAAWMTPGTDRFGGGPMATARSADGGKSWKPGPNPVDDGLTTGHGFIDLAADARTGFHLVWLDSRDGKQGLRYASSPNGGLSWSTNRTLRANTCECCWNSLLADQAGGVHVLYRELSPRDMAVVSSANFGRTWAAPVTVGKFDWAFNGCPHVGGGLALARSRTRSMLHAVVWTGLPGQSGVHHLASTDAGRSWSQPRGLSDADGRRGDIAALDVLRLAATWEMIEDGGSSVVAVTSSDGGKTWSSPRKISSPGASAAYPRVVATRNGFRVFWTETASGQLDRWRMVAL